MKGMSEKVRFRSFFASLLFFAISVFSIGCAVERNHGISRQYSSAVRVSNFIRIVLSVTYHRSDRRHPIGACLSITNLSKKDLLLKSSTTKIFDFAIYRNKGERVWQWSRGKFFAETETDIEMAPHETRSYRISVPSNTLQAGDYIIEGVFLGAPLLKPRVKVSLSG